MIFESKSQFDTNDKLLFHLWWTNDLSFSSFSVLLPMAFKAEWDLFVFKKDVVYIWSQMYTGYCEITAQKPTKYVEFLFSLHILRNRKCAIWTSIWHVSPPPGVEHKQHYKQEYFWKTKWNLKVQIILYCTVSLWQCNNHVGQRETNRNVPHFRGTNIHNMHVNMTAHFICFPA